MEKRAKTPKMFGVSYFTRLDMLLKNNVYLVGEVLTYFVKLLRDI